MFCNFCVFEYPVIKRMQTSFETVNHSAVGDADRHSTACPAHKLRRVTLLIESIAKRICTISNLRRG